MHTFDKFWSLKMLHITIKLVCDIYNINADFKLIKTKSFFVVFQLLFESGIEDFF